MKISKIILLVGSISGILLALISSVLLMNVPKDNEDIYYSDAEFDYIIPQPGDSQVSCLEELTFIDAVVPYYNYSMELAGYNINLYMVDSNDCSRTAFGGGLLLSGEDYLFSDSIIIDKSLSEKLGLELGDSIILSIEGKGFIFHVVGISEDNKFSNRTSAAILFDDEVADIILSTFERVSYSGAFVSVNDRNQAESYFSNSYIPEGKVGEPAWYSSEEIYQYVKDSISAGSAVYEIIDVNGLKTQETSTISRNNATARRYVLTAGLIVAVFLLVLWPLILLVLKTTISKAVRLGTDLRKIVNTAYLAEAVSVIVPFVSGCVMMIGLRIENYGIYTALLFLCYFILLFLIVNNISIKIIIIN